MNTDYHLNAGHLNTGLVQVRYSDVRYSGVPYSDPHWIWIKGTASVFEKCKKIIHYSKRGDVSSMKERFAANWSRVRLKHNTRLSRTKRSWKIKKIDEAVLKMAFTLTHPSQDCFDPLQQGQRLHKLINESLSQAWPKERLNYLSIHITMFSLIQSSFLKLMTLLKFLIQWYLNILKYFGVFIIFPKLFCIWNMFLEIYYGADKRFCVTQQIK